MGRDPQNEAPPEGLPILQDVAPVSPWPFIFGAVLVVILGLGGSL